MKIALLAPFEESVPPKKYGGTELIVYHLAQILSQKHSVFLLATGDSKTKAKLIPTFPKNIRKEKIARDSKIRESLKYIGVAKVVKELEKINPEIIHNHIGWRFLPFAPLFKAPVVTTLHGPLDIPYQQFVYGRYKDFPFVNISNSQKRPFKKLNYVSTVYNGIDLKQFHFNDNPQGNYFAFLARMSPEKGPIQAIEVAKRAGVKLKMAAKVDETDREYFEKKVKPLIDGKQIEFIGEIGPREKDKFLKEATALLVPLQWEEPFGLYMTEAMACGTPVIALKRGSVPEIVIDKKTGFITQNLTEMVQAIKKVKQINRRACRRLVEENFSAEKMVSEYEEVYKKVLKRK